MVLNLKLINIKKQKHVQDHVQINTIKVKSIRYVGKEDVYNMEVENNHNFICNGIVAHNCIDAMRYALETLTINYRTSGISAGMLGL